jgi:hypothetical protein
MTSGKEMMREGEESQLKIEDLYCFHSHSLQQVKEPVMGC